ncbi:MAG TPA: sugar phosphate isomerase/epimerase [Planctomycetota bacterium]|nr:sugar phosphate isomerase/epimerase [Planctomycetota bacterium]
MELQRFAFSTNAYSRHSLKKALKRIAKAGFKGVEILADKPHVWLDSVSPRDVTRIQKQLEKLDLFVSNINANCTFGFWTDAPPEPFFEPSLISRNKALREWRIAYTKKALRFGKEVGAHNVSITSGKALNGVPPEKAQKLLEEGLKRLLDEADRLQQRLSIEYEPALFIEKTSELKALLQKLNSQWLGANLDLGHVDVTGEDPCHAIRALKGRIFNLHLEDIRAHKHYHRIPGDGDMDFRAIFNELDKTGYTGPLTWELYTYDENPDEACVRTYKYLRTLSAEWKLVRGTRKRR